MIKLINRETRFLFKTIKKQDEKGGMKEKNKIKKQNRTED